MASTPENFNSRNVDSGNVDAGTYDGRSAQAPQYDGGGRPRQSGSNGVAIVALIVGLLSVPLFLFLVGGLLGVVAIVLGIVGVRKANALGGTGKGMSITGIVAGALAVVLTALYLAGAVALFSNPQIQDELEQASEQLEQAG